MPEGEAPNHTGPDRASTDCRVLSSPANVVAPLRSAGRRRTLAAGVHEELTALLDAVQRDHGDVPAGQDRVVDALAAVFGLTELDVTLLGVACAPDVDDNVGRAYALLQGQQDQSDPRCRSPWSWRPSPADPGTLGRGSPTPVPWCGPDCSR